MPVPGMAFPGKRFFSPVLNSIAYQILEELHEVGRVTLNRR